MKKNLFLLFSIYFFVLQPLIIGVLRNQANFFRLGAINLIAIIFIGLLSTLLERGPAEHHEHEKKPAPVKEVKPSFQEHFRGVVKERKKKSELIFPSVISFIVAIVIFFMFQYNSSAVEIMLLFALLLGFIVFFSLTFIFKHRITKSFWALVGTKIYLILLVCSLALTGYDYYQVQKDFNINFQDYIAQNFLGQEIIPTDGYVFTGEGAVVGSGTSLSNTTGIQDVSTDIIDIQEETGTVIGTSLPLETGQIDIPDSEATAINTDIVPTTPTIATTAGNQKIMDAVIYLLKKYNIPLITKQDISFTYVSFKNPFYGEWRTAYANKLIGKTTNPSKYIVCESYIVMKGLLEKWDVPYTASTVLNKFWAEAIKRDALNGCVKGKIVTDKTL